MYSPVSGEVVEINSELANSPATVSGAAQQDEDLGEVEVLCTVDERSGRHGDLAAHTTKGQRQEADGGVDAGIGAKYWGREWLGRVMNNKATFCPG